MHASYYEDDILSGPGAYPDEYFIRAAEHGFNAVWLRGILRNLAASEIFPELNHDVARNQDALATVVERARRHDMQVLLYLNEPLCLPKDHPFWLAHPELQGGTDQSMMDDWPESRAFCSSMPATRAWTRELAGNLFRAIPDLGGWFLITASEHHTHCYSHASVPRGGYPDCPRCRERDPLEVVAEVITDLHDGTRAASPTAHCIAWNWGWTDNFGHEPQEALLARLPKDVKILIDWERGGTRRMPDGRENFINEYSLAYIGPSERFMATHDAARRHGLEVMAKLQIGTTHELATVPNLPVVDNLYQKFLGAERLGLAGLLATWNFGNAFSLNTAALARFVRTSDRPSPAEFVRGLAAEYFPGADAAGVARAVTHFSTALAWFPFGMNIIYYGPANYALAYPLTLSPLTGKPMGESWWMRERGDDLQGSLDTFTLEEIIAMLSTLVAEWERGVAVLTEALATNTHPHAAEELGVAKTVGYCYRSTKNVYRTYQLRLERPTDMAARFLPILDDEIATLEAALPLVEADPRLGFHAECQGYQFSADLIRRKMAQLRAEREGITAHS